MSLLISSVKSFIILLSLTIPWNSVVCTSSAHSDLLHVPEFDFFQKLAVRAGFTATTDYESVVVLLQQQGYVDFVASYWLTVPTTMTVDNVTFTQSSTNTNVLNVSSNTNLIVSSSATDSLNVTVPLSFDSMVGDVNYTISAFNNDTSEMIDSVTIQFLIVGMTFYRQRPGEEIEIISGDENQWDLSYQQAMSTTLSWEATVYVFIQYGDGTNSTITSPKFLRYGDSLSMSLVNVTGEIVHDPDTCVAYDVPNLPSTGTLDLCPGCGCGFYYGFDGLLYYGCEFQQYHTGLFSIEFTWPDITAGNPALSGDVYELPLHVNISGLPPLAAVGIYPSTMLRPEGGEVRTLQIINVEFNDAIQFELRVDTIDEPFAMIPGTFQKYFSGNYTYTASFLTQPGNGTDLNWNLFYLTTTDLENITYSEYKMAACASTLVHVFTYDENSLRIDSIAPEFGSESGGETITLTGYFPYFSSEHDAVFMSGYRIEKEFIISASTDAILFKLPPHSFFGSSYEYHVTVQLGFASSNHVLFSYYVYDASLRISVIGASEVSPDTYQVGDCASVRFTGVVSPLTSQILSYAWVLQANSSTTGNMLQDTSLFRDINISAQSIFTSSNSMVAGVYSLRLVVTMVKVVLVKELTLMRDVNIMTIGVHILQPQNRTVTYPDTPLRLSAIISTPSCYQGNQTIVYEWSAFGVVEQYSSLNGTVKWTQAETTPMTTARLGWEFVVPNEYITIGAHDVMLRVWVDGETPPISGEATSKLHIFQSSLVAVIRNGESRVTVNYLTNFHIHGRNSHDPDLFGNERFENLIYEWSCRQSSTLNFATDSSPCIPGLIPDSTALEFLVPMGVAEALVDVSFLQYSLVVRKGAGRISSETVLTIEIQNKGTLPYLDQFSVKLSNTAGTLIEWADVYHFQDLILTVASTNALSTWKYELVEPEQIDFFASHNLIDEPSFYSPPATIHDSSGNTKPLGIRSFALRPATSYHLKVLFAENAEHAETEVIVRIQTNEAIIVNFPPPVITEGEAGSTFILTAGVPMLQSGFSYYFMITDSDGNNLCVGGCTGYDVSTFELNRADNYSITVLLYDSQGTALLSSATSVEQIMVSSSSVSEPYQLKLDKLFLEGNDQAWLMLAQDVIILLLGQELDFITRDGPTEESRVAVEIDFASNIARDGSKLFCNSFPNSMHGNQCISFLYYISALRLLDVETIYNLMQTATCCIKNTPPRTRKLMLPWLTYFIRNLNRLTKQMIQGGNSRTRMVQASGEPANAFADVQIWTGEVTADVAVSGQVDGFTAEFETGDNETVGYISVAMGTQMSDMPADLVNGVSRSVVRGPSQNELFYPRDDCLASLFASGKRIIMVFHVTDNFVVYGFQDPPLRSNLVDRLYWTQVYSVDENWNLRELPVRWNENFCFCWRLPVERLQVELSASVADMPGLYAVERLKNFRQDIQEKGEVFVYNYAGSKTSEYNTTEGWVEGCRGDVGLVSTTVVSKSAQNIIAEDNIVILGKGAWAIVALVIGALLVMLVAVVATWLIAVKAMADSGLFGDEFDVYVERDVYGRSTAPRTRT